MVTRAHSAFVKLAQNGQGLMPAEETPVSSKFGWVQDQFGVSWQLSVSK
ncbi:VOC family protein [Paenibacillus sp. NPDC058071]